MKDIKTFLVDGEHLPYSNFYPSPFDAPFWQATGYVGHWETVEHYYQAAKAVFIEDATRIMRAKSPGESKRIGRKIVMRDTWEAEKYDVMRTALAHKFSPGSELAAYLLNLDVGVLTEGNTWGDRIWGVDGTGRNWLGWLLMAQRDYLRCVTGPQGALPFSPGRDFHGGA